MTLSEEEILEAHREDGVKKERDRAINQMIRHGYYKDQILALGYAEKDYENALCHVTMHEGDYLKGREQGRQDTRLRMITTMIQQGYTKAQILDLDFTETECAEAQEYPQQQKRIRNLMEQIADENKEDDPIDVIAEILRYDYVITKDMILGLGYTEQDYDDVLCGTSLMHQNLFKGREKGVEDARMEVVMAMIRHGYSEADYQKIIGPTDGRK